MRLASNSPCIDAGDNTYAPAGPDLDGNPRIITTVDIGAYEFAGLFYLGDAIVTEGNAGTTNAVFIVGLGTIHSEVVSVDFTTVDGTATAGSDYLATNGTLIFNPGETYKAIIVPVLGDTIEEAGEVFFVRLSNSTNISLVKTQAVGIILDDETVPLSFTGVTVIEGNTGTTNAVFALHLARPYDGLVSVDFTTADGSAVAGADYIATNGTVTFAPGETAKSITILVNGDLMHEEDEMFFVNLSHPVHATLTSTQAIGTILNDEPTLLLYVNVNNPNPVPPYTNWATAATTIQDAIDMAVSGDEILVTNGVYQVGGRAVDGITSRVAVTKPITVRSMNGPAATVIAGYGFGIFPGSVSVVRGAYLADKAALVGFTLTNGAAEGYNGGGVWCSSTSAVVSNCILTSNSAVNGSGAYSGTLNNCVLSGNFAQWFYGNGGGAYGSTLNNCTLTGNSAYYGGGAQDGTLNNCIVYFNISTSTYGANYAGGTFNYSCTTPLPFGGAGNFTNAPLFVNQAGGNLRLQSNSSCINAGNNAYAVTGLDLDGNPRIVGGTVDVGAYEFQSPQSLISYAWLQRYGLPIDTATDSADPDGDRLNNYQEWRAGTDPTKPLSVLRLITVAPDGSGGCFVRFTGGASRSYQLQRATNVAGPWTSITTATAPASELIEFHDTNAPPGSAFYRTATVP